MKILKVIILIGLSITIIFFFPLIWTVFGYIISLLSKYNWFLDIKNIISTYSFIDKAEYIEFSSTLLCIITSSILGYAAYKLTRKSTHNNNVKMALFIKIILENSLKTILNIHKCIPNQKIELPEVNFFEHEFTFLSDIEIEMIYQLYSKILKLSYMQNSISDDNQIIKEILSETLSDYDKFIYNEKYQNILDKANRFFN